MRARGQVEGLTRESREGGMVGRHPGVVISVVGEEGSLTAEGVAARATRLPAEEREAALGRLADRLLIAGEEAVERRITGDQRALVSGDGLSQAGDRRRSAEDRWKLLAI